MNKRQNSLFLTAKSYMCKRGRSERSSFHFGRAPHIYEAKSSYKLKAAFTLVELLVAIALFGLIAAFTLLAYSRVSSQISITTLAYELALSFRQAQSYGVSVREFSGVGGDTFEVGYGLHFDSESSGTYAFFADEGGERGDAIFNGTYGAAYNEGGCLSATECITVYRLEKGNRLYKFCGVIPIGDMGKDAPDENKNEECNTNSLPPSNPTISYLDVVFLRPNPDAIIKTSQLGNQYKAARVYIISPLGAKRVIEVASTGQISVK